MATYSVQLRRIVETFGQTEVATWFSSYNLADYVLPDQLKVIEEAGFFNPTTIANHIIEKFWMREIGFETPGEFMRQAKIRMREIIARQAPLMYTVSVSYDPLINENFTETINRTTQNTGTTTSSANGSGISVASDTPQGQINKDEVLQGKYASQVNATDTQSNGTSDANSNENETITRHREGNTGISATYQKMIEQYRDNIIEVENNIMRDLEDLFMGIW